ncbi:unnamed protein product [Pylaiella littoralis]
MHELLVVRGFVRRADAPDLAELKEREAAAEAAAAEAAATRKKERAEAAARRKLDKETNRKPDKEPTKDRFAGNIPSGMAKKREFDAARLEARDKEAGGSSGEL